MKPFDKIKPSGPPSLLPGEDAVPLDENNARYVQDQINDATGWLHDQIADTKQDLSEEFPPDCRLRLEVLLEACRLAWEHLRENDHN